MGRKCSVFGCTAGYDSERGTKAPPMFICPQKDLLQEWKNSLPQRENYEFSMKSLVCARHFYPEDLITHDEFKLPTGAIHRHERGVPKLSASAVPKIFPNCPSYMTIKQTKKRSSPKKRYTSVLSKRKKLDLPIEKPLIGNSDSSEHPLKVELESPTFLSALDKNNEKQGENMTALPTDSSTRDDEHTVINEEKNGDCGTLSLSIDNLYFTSKFIHEAPYAVKLPGNLPGKLWGYHSDGCHKTVFSLVNDHLEIIKAVEIGDNLQPTVTFQKISKEFPEIKSKEELENLLITTHRTRLCDGYTDDGVRNKLWSHHCTGCIPVGTSLKITRCQSCKKMRISLRKKRNLPTKNKVQIIRKKILAQKQKIRRMSKKVLELQTLVRGIKEKMRKISEQTVENFIATLPTSQQEMVRACYMAAKCTKKGRRYTIQWVYECVLMKIQSPKLYRRLCRENKLPLPTPTTLTRYLKRLRPVYGFQENLFTVLKEKSDHFPEADRHGSLLVDEMALDDAVAFQKDSLQIHGLVDLGKFTPEEDKCKRGDHALVLMFQPFRGQWVQALGAFLSHGAVKGKTLHQIILEAIILLERSGFKVDVVTTDGATWNRQMWEFFGVSKHKFFCQHPINKDRKLRFASDFPHLIKNLWARIANKKELHVPEGVVKLAHWRAIFDIEERMGVKRAFTLVKDHFDPTTYQKMNVKLAMRFFGHTVAAAMKTYREEGRPELLDSMPTILFIDRINNVVHAMNSQIPIEALYPRRDSKHQIVLREFVDYMEIMEEMAAARLKQQSEKKQEGKQKVAEIRRISQEAKNAATGKTSKKYTRACKQQSLKEIELSKEKICVGTGKADFEITTSTFYGLWTTVHTTVDLVQYLHEDVQYSYLMTRRLNQDALEHFFGLIRGACGSSSHPDPQLFIQVFRLMSTYSLIKPPRGSNVTGGEILGSLMELKDMVAEKNQEQHAELDSKLDLYLDGGIPFAEDENALSDHSYMEMPIDSPALTVLAGFVSRKVRKMKPANQCNECFEMLCAPREQAQQDREAFLEAKTYGGLLKPSDDLFSLIFQLEEAVSKVTSSAPAHANFFFHVLDTLLSSQNETIRLGCEDHQRVLTASIITFYLTCRMHFVCRQVNQAVSAKKTQKKNLTKLSKQSNENKNLPLNK